MDKVLPPAADGYNPAAMSDTATAGGQTGVLIVAGVLAWATGEMGRAEGLLRSALERSGGVVMGAARRSRAPFWGTWPVPAVSGMRPLTGIGGPRQRFREEGARWAWRGPGTTKGCSPGTTAT